MDTARGYLSKTELTTLAPSVTGTDAEKLALIERAEALIDSYIGRQDQAVPRPLQQLSRRQGGGQRPPDEAPAGLTPPMGTKVPRQPAGRGAIVVGRSRKDQEVAGC